MLQAASNQNGAVRPVPLIVCGCGSLMSAGSGLALGRRSRFARLIGYDGGMRSFSRIICIAFIAIVLYFTAYALFGRRSSFLDRQTNATYFGVGYNDDWEARVFIPAAAIESYICNRNVATGTRTKLLWRSPVH